MVIHIAKECQRATKCFPVPHALLNGVFFSRTNLCHQWENTASDPEWTKTGAISEGSMSSVIWKWDNLILNHM
jgi:hypothetical protein